MVRFYSSVTTDIKVANSHPLVSYINTIKCWIAWIIHIFMSLSSIISIIWRSNWLNRPTNWWPVQGAPFFSWDGWKKSKNNFEEIYIYAVHVSANAADVEVLASKLAK